MCYLANFREIPSESSPVSPPPSLLSSDIPACVHILILANKCVSYGNVQRSIAVTVATVVHATDVLLGLLILSVCVCVYIYVCVYV